MTTKPITADELEAEINKTKEMARAMHEQHIRMINMYRTCLIAMRALEAVRAFANGATYGPVPEPEVKETTTKVILEGTPHDPEQAF